MFAEGGALVLRPLLHILMEERERTFLMRESTRVFAEEQCAKNRMRMEREERERTKGPVWEDEINEIKERERIVQ